MASLVKFNLNKKTSDHDLKPLLEILNYTGLATSLRKRLIPNELLKTLTLQFQYKFVEKGTKLD